MSLIPSESYSFPDHFTRTVTHSSPKEKPDATLVEEPPPRRKKRFSFSFRKSQTKRKNTVQDELVIPEEWEEEFSPPPQLAEPAPQKIEKPLPVAKQKPPPKAKAQPLPAEDEEWLPKVAPKPAPPPVPKKALSPQPIRKPAPKRSSIEPQPQLPLDNGETESLLAPESASFFAPLNPPTPAPAPPKPAPPPSTHNGVAETIMSPEGLGQFFQPLAPVPAEMRPETSIPEPLPALDSAFENTAPPASPPAETESGGFEVPMTPELLAQLFKAIAGNSAQPQMPPENNFPPPATAPDVPTPFEFPLAAPEAPQPEFIPEPFVAQEEPPPFFAPPMVPPNPLPQRESPIPEPFVAEEIPPAFVPPIARPDPPRRHPNIVAQSVNMPKKLPPQPRRAAVPPPKSFPNGQNSWAKAPVAPPRPEPQIRKSSVPPTLKRKQRWNRAAQDPSASLNANNGTNGNGTALPVQPLPAPPVVPPEQWQTPAPEFFADPATPDFNVPPAEAMYEPSEPAPPTMHPVPMREWAREAPHAMPRGPVAVREVQFERRVLDQRELIERRRKTLKLRRFILWESIMIAILLPLAILGLSRSFKDPSLVVIVDSLAIAAAAAAALIPIFFFAVTSPFPGENPDSLL